MFLAHTSRSKCSKNIKSSITGICKCIKSFFQLRNICRNEILSFVWLIIGCSVINGLYSSSSSTQSLGSVLPSIVETRDQNSRDCPLITIELCNLNHIYKYFSFFSLFLVIPGRIILRSTEGAVNTAHVRQYSPRSVASRAALMDWTLKCFLVLLSD